jgi:outer membrane protein assembly factor BamB
MALGGRWTCEGCGATWDPAARYCGACGSSATSGQPASPRRDPVSGRLRRVVAVVAAVVVLSGLTALALRWPVTSEGLATPEAGPGSEEVALPEPSELPPADHGAGEPGADDQAEPGEASMWQVIDCGGVDCERWRRPFDHLPVHGAWRNLDEVFFVAGDRLVAWDAETGADRWERPISSGVTLGPQELDGGAWRPPSVTGDDVWVVVVGTGGIQVLTRSGAERWTALLTDGEVPIVATLTGGDVLLVATQAPSRPTLDVDVDTDTDEGGGEDERFVDTPDLGIIAFELPTGDVRWRRDGLSLVFPPMFGDVAQDGVMVAHEDGALVALEVADGTERFRLDDAGPGSVTRVGRFVVRDVRAETDADEWQVAIHAAADGRELAVFPRARVGSALMVADHLVAVVQPAIEETAATADPQAGSEAVAVDLAGTIVWRALLEGNATSSCCASVLEAQPGVVRVAAGPGDAATYLDVRSGRVERREHTDRTQVRDEWSVGRDLVLSHESSGQQTTMRDGQGGEPVMVLGGFAQPVLGPGGQAARGGWLLLRVETGLVAVQLPTPTS